MGKIGGRLLFGRTMLYLLILMMSLSSAYGEQVSSYDDLTTLTIDELLNLREMINDELVMKGFILYFDIERGSKGEEVSNIQDKLKELGFYTGLMSGKFDTETQKAFKRFEKANGLESDGMASREDQLALFSAKVPNPQTPVPVIVATADPMKDIYAQYGSFDYSDCLRYPEKHLGEKVVLKGNVLQVLGSRNSGFQIRLSTSGNDDVVYLIVNSDPGYNIIEKDRLTVYGTMQKTITYESTWKVEITIPSANADYIILR